jgi:hypothetical protein
MTKPKQKGLIALPWVELTYSFHHLNGTHHLFCPWQQARPGHDGDHRPGRPFWPEPPIYAKIRPKNLAEPSTKACHATHPRPSQIPVSLARSSARPAAPPRVSQSAPALPFHSARRPYPRLRLRLPAVAVAASSPPEAAEAEGEQEQGEKRRKLYVFNLPWSLPAPEVEKLFAQFGTVKGVEVSVVSCRVELSNAACRYEKRAFRGLGF